MRFPLRKLFLEYSAFAFAAIFNHRYSAWHTPLSFVILVFEIYILVVSSPQLRHYYAARDSCQVALTFPHSFCSKLMCLCMLG